jgi:hypothetical protein
MYPRAKGKNNMNVLKPLAVAAMSIAMLVHNQEAMASGRANCPGAEGGPGWAKNEGVIVLESNDMSGAVDAPGARRCTIKFYGNHKTAPYCSVSGVPYHTSAKVLRTSPTEVTFTFDPPLPSDGDAFDYACMFRD